MRGLIMSPFLRRFLAGFSFGAIAMVALNIEHVAVAAIL